MKIIVHGYTGKLGAAICRAIQAREGFELAAGAAIDAAGAAFPTFNNILDCDVKAGVIIDASSPKALGGLLQYALASGTPLVICTTGHSAADESAIALAAEKIPILKSANMSYGVNLLASLLEKYAGQLFGAGFDVEIIEKHHNQKVDAPSGTALMFANAVKKSVLASSALELQNVYDRTGYSEKRRRAELGLHSIRGGTIAGEHSILFAGQDETLEFTHAAASRDVLAAGALNAAAFLAGKPTGFYTMRDLFS